MRLLLNQHMLATKNHLLVMLTFFCLFTAGHAQNIPDANFAAAIRSNCPTCISASPSNNLLAPAATRTSLNISYRNIANLSGINGFASLQSLFVSGNQLTSLPALPSTLRTLSANSNLLTRSPALPSGLVDVDFYYNRLTSLPALPSGLISLNVGNNSLTSLPSLPSTLVNLYADYNQLTGVPILPSSLQNLGLSGNRLTSVPSLPSGLRTLYINNNRLTSLPSLPSGLRTLDCGYNYGISSLPTLPTGLINLNISGLSLPSLPPLASNLTSLSIASLNLTSLPTLPSGLTFLDISYNRLTSLPTLSNVLTTLYFSRNQISSLPNIPSGMSTIAMDGNPITSLPPLPATMRYLYLDYTPTRITCLPNRVIGLYVYNYFGGFSDVSSTIPVCNGSACSPTIVASPVIVSTVTQTSCIGVPLSVSASASAVGTTTMTVKWQRKKPSDVDFTDVTTAVSYTSGTVASYTVPAISAEDNLTQYRAVFSGTCANSVAIGSGAAEIATREGLNIPDLYFRNAIIRNCPTCINNCGNLTTDAENVRSLNLDNAASFQYISDLTGLEGFVNLEELTINNNSISIFPNLPENLKKLKITNNNLTSLPNLPSTLEMLDCRNNNLTSLPNLPTSLMHLDCSSNKIAQLPADLPEGLMVLDCSNNELIGLPASLPLSIKTLYCHKNKLVTLPTLPTALNYFNCGNNMLSDLPATLPTGLWVLVCSRNPTLRCLPVLPESVHELYISPENVACLRNMPPSMRIYDATNEPIERPLCSPTQCVPFGGIEEPEVLKAKTHGSNTLKAFPNPVDKQLQVAFTATEEGQTTVMVTDVLGRQVSVQMMDTFKGLNQTTVDMSNVPRGVYVLILRTGKTQVVQRITKN